MSRLAFFLPFALCALLSAAAAQDTTRPQPGPVPGKQPFRSQLQANDIAAAPAKFECKTLRVGGRDLAGIAKDGERFTGHAAGDKTFPIHMTEGAHAYLGKCRKSGTVPVFEGAVKQAANGKPALFLSRGLNTAR